MQSRFHDMSGGNRGSALGYRNGCRGLTEVRVIGMPQ